MGDPRVEILEFAGFTLIPSERLLLHGPEPVSLTAKAFDLLTALLRRHGRLATKDELLSEVWAGTIVEEVNLSVTISALRKRLAPDGSGKTLIQTVPKAGYRFVAPVRMRSSGTVNCVPTQGHHEAMWRASSENPDARRAYLEGRYHWNRRSEDGLTKAIASFQRTVSLDPDFALAYSGLADCYATLGYLSHLPPAQTFPAARGYATMALERDAGLAEPHASLAYAKFYFDWDWRGAEQEFRLATSRDPNWAAAHEWYSIYLLVAGRPADALDEITAARDRDPLSLPVNTDLGFHYYYTHQYEEAVRQLKSVLAMNDTFAPAHLWLGRTYQEQRQYDAAISEFRRVEELVSNWPVAIAARGCVEGICGNLAEADAALAQLERLSTQKFVTPYGVALVLAGRGHHDQALSWLEQAFAERSHWLVWLRLDPRWSMLQGNARFARLVNRMRFPAGSARLL
jgi:DNA-binding winged helix-turn-helix (wHTH) protein/Tfp pilus assembly protein PilF